MFALGVGALWEIFEFTMDSLFGMNMQKPMLGDPSGLTDTMWDLIVDATGALVISVLGWRYLKNLTNAPFWSAGLILLLNEIRGFSNANDSKEATCRSDGPVREGMASCPAKWDNACNFKSAERSHSCFYRIRASQIHTDSP